MYDWLNTGPNVGELTKLPLTIINDGTKHTSSPSVMAEISRFAERCGLGFIVSDLTAAGTDLPFSVRNLAEYKLPLLSIHLRPVGTSAHDSYDQLGHQRMTKATTEIEYDRNHPISL